MKLASLCAVLLQTLFFFTAIVVTYQLTYVYANALHMR